MSYQTLTATIELTHEVKRSKFIAYAASAQDRKQALEILNQRRTRYQDARHHCWAYLIGSPSHAMSMAMSDDGEPSGTAGKPILNVLQHNSIGNIMLVVTRYFGGTKLGAGGLVRAYSSSAQRIIDNAKTEIFIEKARCKLICNFEQEQFLRHLLSRLNGTVEDAIYGIEVTLIVLIPATLLNELKALCSSYQFSISTA